jgi:hypothetical protein
MPTPWRPPLNDGPRVMPLPVVLVGLVPARLLGVLAVGLGAPVVGAALMRFPCLAVVLRGLPLLLRDLAALLRALVLAHCKIPSVEALVRTRRASVASTRPERIERSGGRPLLCRAQAPEQPNSLVMINRLLTPRRVPQQALRLGLAGQARRRDLGIDVMKEIASKTVSCRVIFASYPSRFSARADPACQRWPGRAPTGRLRHCTAVNALATAGGLTP